MSRFESLLPHGQPRVTFGEMQLPISVTTQARCKRLDLCWPQWVHFGSQEHHRTSWTSMESHGTS
jgi:hypothetical protein